MKAIPLDIVSINLNHAIDVLILKVLEQFSLMLMHNLLGDEFITFRLTLIDDDLMILS